VFSVEEEKTNRFVVVGPIHADNIDENRFDGVRTSTVFAMDRHENTGGRGTSVACTHHLGGIYLRRGRVVRVYLYVLLPIVEIAVSVGQCLFRPVGRSTWRVRRISPQQVGWGGAINTPGNVRPRFSLHDCCVAAAGARDHKTGFETSFRRGLFGTRVPPDNSVR